MNLGTLGHYAVNSVNGVNDKVVAWLVERDPDGMSAAEIDAQLARLSTLSVEVSKAHTKSDVSKAAYEVAVSQNAIRLHAAETAQAKIDKEPAGPKRSSMEADLAAHLESVEADQEQLDSLKAVYQSASDFYTYLDGLFNEKGTKLRSMKAKLATASNTLKANQAREEQSRDQAKVAKSVVGGSHGVDKFDVAMNALKKSTQESKERTEANERVVKQLTTPTATSGGFMAQELAAASGQTSPPTSAADRIAALKARAA